MPIRDEAITSEKPTYGERSGCAENMVCCPFTDSRGWVSRRRANSQLGSMCECGRRTSGWIGLIPEVHGCDKTAVRTEYVENLAVRKNIPLKALDGGQCGDSTYSPHLNRLAGE
jgi:hypothetical protein